ncbi:MAG: hypothetical protein HOY76_53330 [Streptomyces sp.]|nr:hypothetical protein [Streptomyces sp.]
MGLRQQRQRAPPSPPAPRATCPPDYLWSAPDNGSGRALLRVEVTPVGDWNMPLPRVELDIVLPAAPTTLTWYGGGPGEAYPDTCAAARIGRFTARVEELQTPLSRPAGERQQDRCAVGRAARRTGRQQSAGERSGTLLARGATLVRRSTGPGRAHWGPASRRAPVPGARRGTARHRQRFPRARRTARPSARCRTDVLRRGVARRLTVSQVGSTDGGATDSRAMRWVPSTT